MRFDGKVAIVTGAAQGIGEACVKRLRDEGAMVVGADISADLGGAMRKLGALAVHADVSDPQSVDNLLAETLKAYGKVDILVNNAGIVSAADFLDYSLEQFERVLKVNLFGAFITGQAVARHIVARNGTGAIINMSSVNAKLALLNQTAYVVSKGGINQLTTVMAVSLADKGIRVNGVGPGTILTEMTRNDVFSNEASRQRILSRTPMGRPGEVEEIASVVAFLASDDASYMTGQTVYVDGGRMGLNYTVSVQPQ
ncbi:MAG: 3-oxoacyl-[acyl-carrier protein] reductase [Sphingomonadales bacterium]|nr:3-oxoacyl-[acyl-carrier protein] reductase [Sphingomonadales bacterium]